MRKTATKSHDEKVKGGNQDVNGALKRLNRQKELAKILLEDNAYARSMRKLIVKNPQLVENILDDLLQAEETRNEPEALSDRAFVQDAEVFSIEEKRRGASTDRNDFVAARPSASPQFRVISVDFNDERKVDELATELRSAIPKSEEVQLQRRGSTLVRPFEIPTMSDPPVDIQTSRIQKIIMDDDRSIASTSSLATNASTSTIRRTRQILHKLFCTKQDAILHCESETKQPYRESERNGKKKEAGMMSSITLYPLDSMGILDVHNETAVDIIGGTGEKEDNRAKTMLSMSTLDSSTRQCKASVAREKVTEEQESPFKPKEQSKLNIARSASRRSGSHGLSTSSSEGEESLSGGGPYDEKSESADSFEDWLSGKRSYLSDSDDDSPSHIDSSGDEESTRCSAGSEDSVKLRIVTSRGSECVNFRKRVLI